MENIINKIFKRNKPMRDVQSAIKFIQSQLREGERIIVTKKGFDIRSLDKDERGGGYPHERRPDDIDTEMHKAMFGD
jgi:hypothetical protein